jgi:hydroxyacylglutathione hydrolase
MTAEELERLIRAGQPPLVLDVRTGPEYNNGHIAGAVHAPLPFVGQALTAAGCSKDASIVITCEHGPRAQLARAFLKFRGYWRIELLDGHMAGWRRAGRTVTRIGG